MAEDGFDGDIPKFIADDTLALMRDKEATPQFVNDTWAEHIASYQNLHDIIFQLSRDVDPHSSVVRNKVAQAMTGLMYALNRAKAVDQLNTHYAQPPFVEPDGEGEPTT